MKKYIQLLLYCISLAGIGINLLFEVKVLGLIGYACLIVASIIQIIRVVRKR